MNLSFAGCGFLGIYHVGVAVCLKKYAPHLLLGKISGASFGALSACCLLCDLPIGEITSDVLRVVREARAGSLGPFSPSFNIQNVLLDGMQRYLPADAHRRVSGRLHVSLTRVYDGKNVIVSEFPTREDLLQALLASCFVPVFSGLLPPRFRGLRYMDGGFSDNLPVLDENTVTVSPFCGESDICPRDLSSQLFHVNLANTSIELSKQNMSRFARILFPPRPEVLSDMCRQGFDDALRFLQRNALLSCTRCLALSCTLPPDPCPAPPDCQECHTHRQVALADDLPDTVLSIFQRAIESANGGLANWLRRRRCVRALALAALPARLPLDILCATLTNYMGDRVERREMHAALTGSAWSGAGCAGDGGGRLVSSTPGMSRGLWRLSRGALRQLHAFAYGADDRSRLCCALEDTLPAPAPAHEDHDHHDPAHRHRRRSAWGAEADEADTFEHILRVTGNHDALLAYYYLDSDDQMKVTQIFDVTEADTEAVQSPAERVLNSQLQFDECDWTAHTHLLNTEELAAEALAADALAERRLFAEPDADWAPEADRH